MALITKAAGQADFGLFSSLAKGRNKGPAREILQLNDLVLKPCAAGTSLFQQVLLWVC